MSSIDTSPTATAAVSVPLPEAVRRRKLAINGVLAIIMLTIAITSFNKGSWVVAVLFLVFGVISMLRIVQLRQATHVCLQNAHLKAYDPNTGGSNRMLVAEIGSIQFRPGSDRNLVKLPDRFIVRSKHIERELEVFVLTDEQKPKLEAFFRSHFPEQYQESVSPLPGFPPTRE